LTDQEEDIFSEKISQGCQKVTKYVAKALGWGRFLDFFEVIAGKIGLQLKQSPTALTGEKPLKTY